MRGWLPTPQDQSAPLAKTPRNRPRENARPLSAAVLGRTRPASQARPGTAPPGVEMLAGIVDFQLTLGHRRIAIA